MDLNGAQCTRQAVSPEDFQLQQAPAAAEEARPKCMVRHKARALSRDCRAGLAQLLNRVEGEQCCPSGPWK
eukprot:6330261-Amphidinium_carterae.2